MDDFSDLNRSADDNEEFSTESDLNEKENDAEKDALNEVEREALSDVEKEAMSDVEKDVMSDVERDVLNDVEEDAISDVEEDEMKDLHDAEEDDLKDAEEDGLHDGEEDGLHDAKEGGLGNAQGDDLDDVKSANEGDVEQVAANGGIFQGGDIFHSGGVFQSGDIFQRGSTFQRGDHQQGDYEGDADPHDEDQPGEGPDGESHLLQDPQKSGLKEDTHKKEDDYSHTLNEPPSNKEQFGTNTNETNNPPSNGEGKNGHIDNDSLNPMDPIQLGKKRYEHFIIHPSNQNDMSLFEGINKKLTFPSLSPTDFPIPGKEEESSTMYHFAPEKLGYKHNNGLNPSEGYLLIYPHVSRNSVPPKIRKKKLRCC
ncbi:hypothetical protein PVMG_02217 [Plasmodium vivax Mauritania I]|uniref:Uncharacterized protein n=2 Tax=Plasmodium vivax TaxID=5855 RepID=A0A0J9TAX3_PLAVI|nr:hypothetical protein PVBG_01265 [Plasmodium vivax Brazil I]KMZ92229.1 hypothetical protein PVMG_02217 [Plasmodium vivax Mauritania I]